MTSQPLLIGGLPASPYTRKMLGVLRYRRIVYRLVPTGAAGPRDLPAPKPVLLPIFWFRGADGALTPVTDSTPIIRRLESEYADRPLLPRDPALAFIDALIEDFADEWLTKAMFHYRWSYQADVVKAGSVLPNWVGGPMDDTALGRMNSAFSDRQIGRLRYVGSNEITRATIESSFDRLIALLERHLMKHRFMLGERPGAGDFGLFGQLTQLALFDPTPMAIVTTRSPRLVAWTWRMEDLSGHEEDGWFDAADLPATIRELLSEIGRTYAPLLLANAEAVAKGEAVVRATIDGRPWEQAPFAYQAKCLRWLREDYARLDDRARRLVAAALKGTGCEAMFAA